jgi:DNA invertase Pin-like site-specific DNA recombinase
MEAIGYCRVFTLNKRKTESVFAAQEAKIVAWCTAHDYELAACYEDAGLSGSRARSPKCAEKNPRTV